jgi:hypothetical protein
MAERIERILVSVIPPPRSVPVCTLLRSLTSIPYEPKTIPGWVPAVSVATVTTPEESSPAESGGSSVESIGTAVESVGIAPAESVLAGVAVEGASAEGLSWSLSPHPAARTAVREARASQARPTN